LGLRGDESFFIRRDIFLAAVFGLMIPFEAALSILETRIDSTFLASSVFFAFKSAAKFLAAVLSSDLVEMFLKCLFLAFLNSLYAVLSVGTFLSFR